MCSHILEDTVAWQDLNVVCLFRMEHVRAFELIMKPIRFHLTSNSKKTSASIDKIF